MSPKHTENDTTSTPWPAHALTKEKLDDVAQASVSSNSNIHRLYLGFHTRLPQTQTAQENGATLPECPDLSPYICPFEWSPMRKSVLLVLSCIATTLTAYTAGAYSPPSLAMAKDFHSEHVVVLVGITTFCLGFGFAPMALAPFSELWGRYPIFLSAGVVFVVFQAVCSVMPNVTGMLICRFLVGCGASVFSSVVGGVIADLWEKQDRNTPMAFFSCAVIFGTGAGPLVSAAIMESINDQTLAWKWTFWHQAIADGLLVLALGLFFRESRASVLLTRKAKKLNSWYEDLEAAGAYGVWISPAEVAALAASPERASSTASPSSDVSSTEIPQESSTRCLRRIRWVVESDEQRPALRTLISSSLQRPFHMLFTEPVVFCFSLWAAFSWAILYLSFSVVSFLYAGHLNLSSRSYIAMMVSAVVATIAGIAVEQLLKHPQWKSEGPHSDSKFWALMREKFPADSPESRLYFACVTATLLPAGLFAAFLVPRAWTEYALAVGMGFSAWGIYSVYLATFNYLADTYHIYASSALAAQSLCRNLLGGVFPVITKPLFTNLGLKGAGGMLGGIATGLTLIPWVLVFFGKRIRARSKFATHLQKTTSR